ncbi:MAG: hypothetical protein JRI25_03790 [Deltaproteobacteria bacterium]|nr:hypothetical protein [Deltaproteobacteria bacterium]MBW2253700.1 hypothetical protein [Deltaproteobacteria bacterium]
MTASPMRWTRLPIHPLLTLVAFLWGLLATHPALAEGRSICVYDPSGRAGDFVRIMEQYAIEASSWGLEVEIRAYTDEETATKDYEASNCDAVVATGVRLQRFNRFPATLEAIGAVPDYDLLQQMVTTLATYESAAARLRSGEHETVGFISAGSVYLFVRDREVDTVSELAGLRIATMDYDIASPTMVERVGAIMVPADLGSIGPKFNNGDVDACYMSAPGFRPFELWRGLEPDGGIIHFPLAQATLQVMIRAPLFPNGFSAKSRTWFATHLVDSIALSKRADADIPDKHWIEVPADRREKWDEMFLDVRLRLRDDVGAYDGSMLTALRKLRCASDSSRAECAEKRE